MQKVLYAGLLGVLPVALLPAATAGKGPPRNVTLSATPRVLPFGSPVGLTGAVVPAQANQSVTIQARPCGQASFTSVVGVKTGTKGTYSAGQAPVANTAYQAQWHSITSALVLVRVRPNLKLKKLAPHKFRIRVMAVRSFADHRALFQKHSAEGWSTLRKVRLKNWGQVGSTSVSGRIFKSKVKEGKKVRILLSRKQAGSCYASGHSRTIGS